MNTAVVSALIAKLTAGCGLVLLLPLLTALFWEEPVLPFIYSMALCFYWPHSCGIRARKSHQSESPRRPCGDRAVMDMYFHSLPFPYFLSGLLSPLDALVESISGLTGTGATVLPI